MDRDDFYQYAGDVYIDRSELESIVDEAEDELSTLESAVLDAKSELERGEAEFELAEWKKENEEPLKELRKIIGEMSWQTLIRADRIYDHLNDFVENTYEIPKNLPAFITLEIDYDMLLRSYSEITYDNTLYYVEDE